MPIRVKDVPLTIQGGLGKVLFVTTWPSRGPASPRLPAAGCGPDSPGPSAACAPRACGGSGGRLWGPPGAWPPTDTNGTC